MPALEAQLSRLTTSHTQALGVSIDSIYVHANFGSSLGGISYPLLADFHPKGAMADSMGVYNSKVGITDRATIIIDAQGIVRHASATGHRDMEALAKICEEIDAEHGKNLPAPAEPAGVDTNAVVYVRNNCPASRSVLLALDNLHLGEITIKNVSDNEEFLSELKAASGAETAPVFVVNGKVTAESATIVSHLAEQCAVI